MSDPKTKETLTFHLLKTPTFQTLHADGVFTGLGPGGNVFLAFYTERMPIPTSLVHAFKEDGSLGERIGMTGKRGIVREIHTGITLSLETLDDLEKHIAEIRKQFQENAADS